MKKGVVFGSFDHFHSGHQWFLKETKRVCDHLTVIVATDENIKHRKHRTPTQSLHQRVSTLKNSALVDKVLTGDTEEGEWTAFQRNTFDIVFVGYDQHELLNALKKIQPLYSFEIIQLGSYFPEKYKSSLYV